MEKLEYMFKLLGSASKLVFLSLTISACVGFFMGILSADSFMLLASGAYAYYFTRDNQQPPSIE